MGPPCFPLILVFPSLLRSLVLHLPLSLPLSPSLSLSLSPTLPPSLKAVENALLKLEKEIWADRRGTSQKVLGLRSGHWGWKCLATQVLIPSRDPPQTHPLG